MVDSCFKVFRKTKCLNRKRCDSYDSYYLNEDKCACGNNNNGGAKISNINNNNDNSNKVVNDLSNEIVVNDMDHHDSEVVLRRHNRKYLHSISTVSNDAMSSDDDDETLDILYPLPHVNTHERSLNCTDDIKRIDKNGMIKKLSLLITTIVPLLQYIPFLLYLLISQRIR